ncbi:MAG: NAD-dependent protein deacylase [Acidobacteriota bacterium]|nr:NAD-dependent protein deacylase [Acidobacteriota bacterium]
MSDSQPSLARALVTARRVAVMTGAGISAESGVPTFRDADGLWEGRRPEEVATPEAFAADPVMVWEFYDARRANLARCRPNAGHRALARLESIVPELTLVTQNVDGLHQLAGSTGVHELHGNIWRLRCERECGVDREDRRVPLPRPLPPPCPCGARLRPGVVWFGEPLPPAPFAAAERAARRAELFLVVGTSGVVEPAASLARIAHSAGARVVEINPRETALSSVAHDRLRETAATALPRLVEPGDPSP